MKEVTCYLKVLFFTFEGKCDCKIGGPAGRKRHIYTKPAKDAPQSIQHCRQHRKHIIDGVGKQLAIHWKMV